MLLEENYIRNIDLSRIVFYKSSNSSNNSSLTSLVLPIRVNDILNNNDQIDSFQIDFYDQELFSSIRNVNVDSNIVNYMHYKPSDYANEELDEFQRNIRTNYISSNNLNIRNSFNITFNIDDIEAEQYGNRRFYSLVLDPETTSELIEYRNFDGINAVRIFATKNNNIIYDSKVMFIDQQESLRNKLDNAEIDYLFFINRFLYQDIVNSISIESRNVIVNTPQARAPSNLRTNSAQREEVSRQTTLDIVSPIANSARRSTNFVLGNNISSVSSQIQITSASLQINEEFFDLNVNTNPKIFNNKERISEIITDEVIIKNNELNLILNFSIAFYSEANLANFSKEFTINRQSSLVIDLINNRNTNITDISVDNIVINDYYNNFINDVSRESGFNFIKLDINLSEGLNNLGLENASIKSIKINNVAVNQFFLTENFEIESQLSIIGTTISELVSDGSISFYVRNLRELMKFDIEIVINSTLGGLNNDITFRFEESEFTNKIEYSKNVNQVQSIANNNFTITLEEDFSSSNDLIRIEQIKLSNLQEFNSTAYSFGYYTDTFNSNAPITGQSREFIKACIFRIQVINSIENNTKSEFKYYFGKDFFKDIELETNNDDFLIVKESITNLFLLQPEAVSQNTRFINKINNLLNINSLSDIDSSNLNIDISKTVSIKIFPVHKLVSLAIFASLGHDDYSNIKFSDDITDNVYKKNVHLRFTNMFYDTNSSLSWNAFLNYRNKLLSLENDNGEVKANNASNVMKYLFSSLYYESNNQYEISQRSNLTNIISSNNNLNNSSNIDFYKVSKAFANLKERFFNLDNKNSEFFNISAEGIVLRFTNFLNNIITKPQNIDILQNNNSYIDLNISQLLEFFNINQIRQASYNIKLLLIPVFNNLQFEYNLNNLNNNFTTGTYKSNLCIYPSLDYINKDISSFNTFFNPINYTFITEDGEESAALRVTLDSLNLNQFRQIFNDLKSLDSFYLNDILIRVGLSIEINNNFYFLNNHVALSRLNFNNEIISIDNLSI